MPTKPSIPKPTSPRREPPVPRQHGLDLERVRENERLAMRKRRGFMSTMLTRGGVGMASTEKSKVLGV